MTTEIERSLEIKKWSNQTGECWSDLPVTIVFYSYLSRIQDRITLLSSFFTLRKNSVHEVINSLVPELSFLPAPYSGWTRAGEKRVQETLHTHAQNEQIKKLPGPNLAARVNVSRNAFFQLALWKKNMFFDVDIVVKKHKNVKIKIWFIVFCTLIDNEFASLLCSQTLFRIVSACWASLQKFFKGKSDT